jgi:simple sugar transport system ATP-binding protein
MSHDPARAPAAAAPRLALSGITKHYPGVLANDRIDLAVAPGEIHAVLGENGAGKSTLMKIVYGVVRPDAGTMQWNGEPVQIEHPAQARRLGIGMVFQHFALFDTLSVVDNIRLALPRSATAGLARRIRDVSARYGLPLDPAQRVHGMPVGLRQRVEIVRCLLQAPRLLIMDEPTSVLAPDAVARLFETLRTLAAEGCSILYVSHKLDEIRALCDRATILRDGRVAGVCDPRRETSASLAKMMIGSDLPHPVHREARVGAPALVVDALDLAPAEPFATALRDVSFDVRTGEIVGIAGVSGNGQDALFAALSGERTVARPDAVRLVDTPVGRRGPAERRALGLAAIPEERLGRGAVPEMSLAENTLLTGRGGDLVTRGFVRMRALRRRARATIDAFAVRAQGPDAPARSLSGGNLQKFIVGREILQQPRVLLVAQPTWGVDVGASAHIRQALLDLRDRGAAVLVISDELDELFEICDRLGVMAQGRLSPPGPVRETNAEEIGLLMAGTKTAARATSRA